MSQRAVQWSTWGALCGAFCVLLAGMLSAAGGASGPYPLDDAYIHMAVARTVAEVGTWGLAEGAPSNASSSPAWTALLAAYYFLAGPSEAAPLVLNIVASVAILWVAAEWRTPGEPAMAPLLRGALIIVAVPLPYLAGLGMEHTLHLLVSIVLARRIGAADSTWGLIGLACLGFVAPLVRYEALFLVTVGVLLLIRARRFRAAAALTLPATLSVITWGALWVSLGEHFVPNSLLMKSAFAGGWFDLWEDNLGEGVTVVALAATVAALRRDAPIHAMLYGGACLLHMMLARMGWLYRYEAYLVGWGVLLLGPYRPVHAQGGLLAVLLAAPLCHRSARAVDAYGRHVRIIENSDIAAARFVAEEWPEATVAAHNIGALAWFTRATIVDVAGLASAEVTRLHLAHSLTGATIGNILRRERVELAVLDQRWLAGDFPHGLSEVGRFTFDVGSGVTATNVVWACDPGQQDAIRRSLQGFAERNPGGPNISWGEPTPFDLSKLLSVAGNPQVEGEQLAFYSNARVELVSPADGTFVFRAAGTPADGRGPHFTVSIGDHDERFYALHERAYVAGPVAKGDRVRLDYADDLVDAAGNDRNLWISQLQVR